LLECWKRDLIEKAKHQKNLSLIKKKLLEDFCKENDMIPVWFTQKTRKDLYVKLKKEYVNSEKVI
jgi:ribosomal protein L39E